MIVTCKLQRKKKKEKERERGRGGRDQTGPRGRRREKGDVEDEEGTRRQTRRKVWNWRRSVEEYRKGEELPPSLTLSFNIWLNVNRKRKGGGGFLCKLLKAWINSKTAFSVKSAVAVALGKNSPLLYSQVSFSFSVRQDVSLTVPGTHTPAGAKTSTTTERHKPTWTQSVCLIYCPPQVFHLRYRGHSKLLLNPTT